MKVCSLCKNNYEDWVEFCFQDGHPLVAAPVVAAVAAPPPPPVSSSVASAPSLDPGASADWDAFDAPE
ncbi:MAG: hypothetical protein FJ090_10805, partial [Deltaproteobacteria bacterium]|nr:hypothetical protein [Deltaproteobacteria bacterium]